MNKGVLPSALFAACAPVTATEAPTSTAMAEARTPAAVSAPTGNLTQPAASTAASACTGDCATQWPSLISQGAPVAGGGVDSTMLSMLTRADGSIQVTYHGWPLYLFSGDAAPGDANGQAMDGLWFLVTPAGEAVP